MIHSAYWTECEALGHQERATGLFSYARLDDRIASDYPLRAIYTWDCNDNELTKAAEIGIIFEVDLKDLSVTLESSLFANLLVCSESSGFGMVAYIADASAAIAS